MPKEPALAQTRRRRFLDRVRAEIAPEIGPGPLGLAVSGGGDSLAMLYAMAEHAAAFGWVLSVATVDHGLRPEAADEARMVSQRCADLGIAHQTLRWDHAGAVSGNLMDAARRARYRLLADWAQGLGRVAVAHTADDQAETVLMGLSRAAGLDGLAGLRPQWDVAGVRFLRPFLAVTRAEMQSYLADCGVVWVDDPTNDDMAFDRVKARRAMLALRGLGVTPAKIARVARNLAAVQADLRGMVADAAARVVTEAAGALVFDRVGFSALPDEVARRLAQGALLWLSGEAYAPRGASVVRFVKAVRDGHGATLAGCRLLRGGQVVREPRAAGGPVPVGQVWDGRWRVQGPGGDVRALGADGLGQVPDWRAQGISRDAALVLPGVWEGDKLIAAPLLRFGEGYTATLTAGFGLFLLSH